MLALLAALALAQQPGSLAGAIAAAAPGDTIRLAPGTYHGALVLDRPLVLLGGPDAILDGGHQGNVITVRSDSVSLVGFTVRGSGRSLDRDEAAIKLEHCTGCRVERITIEDPLHGIYLLESHDVDLTDNRITGAADLVESSRGNGIHLWNSTGNRITGNRVRGTRDGIYFSFAGHNLVAHNDVREVRYGLHYMYSDDNRFEANTFEHNAAGAAIMFSKRIIFRDNVFSRHIGYRAYGILLHTASEVTAEGNRIEGNLTGLFLDGSTGSRFRNNLVRGNGVGIDLLASTEGNIFSGNVIGDNRIAVRKVLGTSENAWSDSGRGNFWNDRQVFDLDGDGVGDRPYQAGDPFAGLATSRPVLDIFSGTLAARALAWADEAFPVFDLPRVSDPHPLAQAPAWLRAEAPAPVMASASSTRRVPWWPLLPVVSVAMIIAYRARRRPVPAA
jgi:nitrous oxidase accessory protein